MDHSQKILESDFLLKMYETECVINKAFYLPETVIGSNHFKFCSHFTADM